MIYHYCDANAFQSIIKTKQVWLTDITKQNDTSEYYSGFDIIMDVLEEKGLLDLQDLQDITTYRSNDEHHVLIGCFSKEGDSGTQWRLYADDSQGLSIGFDEREIANFNIFNRFTENDFKPIFSSVIFHEVNYDKQVFSNTVSEFIDEMTRNDPRLRNKLLAVGLRRLAATYKDKFFIDEREVRAVVEIDGNETDNYVIDERINAYKEKARYHKLLTSFDDLNAIKEVIIGPNCPFTEDNVAHMLSECGLQEVLIRYSSGRGRYRTVSK